MADFPAGPEHVLRDAVSSLRCRVCRRAFERDQVRLAARHEQVWLVSVRCTRCRNQHVFWLAVHEKDAPMHRELTAAEEERFAELDAISSDHVLDMHEFLAAFDGNFRLLFQTQGDLL